MGTKYTQAGRELIAEARVDSSVSIYPTMVKFGTGQYEPTGLETDIRTPFSPAIEYAENFITRHRIGSVTDFTVPIYRSVRAVNIGEAGLFVGSTLIVIESQPAASGWILQHAAVADDMYNFEVTDSEAVPMTGELPTGAFVVYAATAAAKSVTIDGHVWLKCDGQAVSRSTYMDLFGLFIERYGAGDGSTTFGLPTIAATQAPPTVGALGIYTFVKT